MSATQFIILQVLGTLAVIAVWFYDKKKNISSGKVKMLDALFLFAVMAVLYYDNNLQNPYVDAVRYAFIVSIIVVSFAMAYRRKNGFRKDEPDPS